MKTYTRFRHLAQSFCELEMCETKAVDEIKTHILNSITYFFECHTVYGICGQIL
jgi:hypothetical protein